MSQVASDTVNIEAAISGEIKGQVAIGSNILQIGSISGGIVNIAMPGQVAPPRPRPGPIHMRPRPFPGLLDRRAETAAALGALRSAEPVEVCGENGIGKSSLLRRLAHAPLDASFPDGVVSVAARGQSVDDVLQFLFDAFYESDPSMKHKVTAADVRHALQSKRALVVLDDAELKRDDLQALMDAAPDCTFLIAAADRQLWGEGRSIALPGLPIEDGLALIERELGHALTDQERPAAQALCEALQGNPLHILQAMALVREKRQALPALLVLFQHAPPAEVLDTQARHSLSEPERRIVNTLAALGSVPLRLDHLAEVTDLGNSTAQIVGDLSQRGIVTSSGPHVSLAGNLGAALAQSQDITPWATRLLTYLTQWADSPAATSAQLLEDQAALLQSLQWAAAHGLWQEALRFASAIEETLALNGRWDAWNQVLQVALEAARALPDVPAEAWALHQSGTRALCLGIPGDARSALIRALRLRESLKDYRGAAVTRHNLNILLGPPLPPKDPPAPTPGSPAAGIPLLVKALAGMAILILGVWTAGKVSPPQAAGPTPIEAATISTAAPTRSATAVPASAPTNTSTPPPTSTATATPTHTVTPLPTVKPCNPRYDWPSYIVQSGDSLSSIAVRVGSTIDELMSANCLTDTRIYSGRPLQVPRLPQLMVPEMALKPDRLDFGRQQVRAASVPRSIVVNSVGSAGLSLQNITVTGSGAGDFVKVEDGCTGISLAPGTSCSISLSFAPQTVGNRDASLMINDNAPGSPHQVMLSGSGLGQPEGQVDPAYLDFGQQPIDTSGRAQSVSLTNIGSAALTVKGMGILEHAEVSDFQIVQDGCSGQSLEPGARCDVQVVFAPVNLGRLSGVLSIADDASNSPQSVSLAGVGITTVPSPVSVSLSAEPASITAGQCANLTWKIASFQEVQQAYLSGGQFDNSPVNSPSGTYDACPKITTTYVLRAMPFKGKEQAASVTIEVMPVPAVLATPAPTVAPTYVPMLAPAPVLIVAPTYVPMVAPTPAPTVAPTSVPSPTAGPLIN